MSGLAKAVLIAPSNRERRHHVSSLSWSRFCDWSAPVLPQKIISRFDHQGLNGRISVKGELP
jgi:hypothetical protein